MIENIENILLNSFKKLNYKENYCKVSVSSRLELCDYQINSVFNIAKEEHKNPIEIGEALVKEINEMDDLSLYFKSVSFVKPGFINIVASDKFISNELNKEIKNDPIKKIEDNLTVVVDYGGPNIAKPLHVGHMRPAIIGESIYRILKKKGYKTIGDVHLGDYGLQIGQVIYGAKKRNLKPSDITLKLLDEIYPEMSALCKQDEETKKKCEKYRNMLQDGDKECEEYFNVMYDISLKDIKRIYKYLDINFDYWYGEKDSAKYMNDVIKYFEDKNMIKKDNGALIIPISEESDKKEMPPVLVQGSDGAFLYHTSDLATIYQRMKDFDPNYILYVVDDRQRLHFEQIFRACKKSGLSKDAILEHNYFGTINGPDGKPFKTRSGDILKLDDLIAMAKEGFMAKKESNKDMKEEDIDKIVNAIIKFADLQNNREKNYIFDINKFADVNGKTGPYILYTALRIRKIIEANEVTKKEVNLEIYNEQDRDLRMKLLGVDSAVTKACEERMPHYIAEYLYELCVIVNTFYQNNNINNLEDKNKKDDWLALLKFTYNTIEELLNLLIIEIPSEM